MIRALSMKIRVFRSNQKFQRNAQTKHSHKVFFSFRNVCPIKTVHNRVWVSPGRGASQPKKTKNIIQKAAANEHGLVFSWKGLALKLDFEKSYDKTDWFFLGVLPLVQDWEDGIGVVSLRLSTWLWLMENLEIKFGKRGLVSRESSFPFTLHPSGRCLHLGWLTFVLRKRFWKESQSGLAMLSFHILSLPLIRSLFVQ